MEDKPDIVQVKMNKEFGSQIPVATKAFQVSFDDNKTVIVYNHIQGYILNSLFKVVFK
jgi:hypothetical protein